MNSRQKSIAQVLSSSATGIIGFYLTMPIVILTIGTLLGPLEGHAFIAERDLILYLTSILLGLIDAVFVEIKYYRDTIIAGTFQFDAIDDGNTIHVTEGRFDLTTN